MASYLERWETDLVWSDTSVDLMTMEGGLVFSFPLGWTNAMVW